MCIYKYVDIHVYYKHCMAIDWALYSALLEAPPGKYSSLALLPRCVKMFLVFPNKLWNTETDRWLAQRGSQDSIRRTVTPGRVHESSFQSPSGARRRQTDASFDLRAIGLFGCTCAPQQFSQCQECRRCHGDVLETNCCVLKLTARRPRIQQYFLPQCSAKLSSLESHELTVLIPLWLVLMLQCIALALAGHCSQQICSNCMILSCQYWPKSPRNFEGSSPGNWKSTVIGPFAHDFNLLA